jgi:NAD(P)-dependent dehydrogenase (short-subunit alcohol dehydrogenase family)
MLPFVRHYHSTPLITPFLPACSTFSLAACSLAMSHFVVIGASSGVGLQVAKNLAEKGHEVTATYHRHPKELPGVSYVPLDVLNETPDFSFLPPVVHGLVYCPGSIQLKPFARIKEADFLADYALQVTGAVKVLQAALPALKAAGNASVVLYSTVAVQMGLPFHSLVAASKGAVEGLTRALAAELAPVIRVNCIAPSLTDTPSQPAFSIHPKSGKQLHSVIRLNALARPKTLPVSPAFFSPTIRPG